jgi:hypothetical protein
VLAFAARAADQQPPVFQQDLVTPEASNAAPPQITLATTDPKAAKVTVVAFSVQDGGNLLALGAVGGGRLELGVTNAFEWSGLALTFPDGQPGMVTVWLDTAVDSEAPVLGIPGVLSSASANVAEDTMLLLQLAPDGASALASDFILNGGGELLSVLSADLLSTAYDDLVFAPVYTAIDAAGNASKLVGNPVPLPAAGFNLPAVSLPAGRYALRSVMTSIWGSVASDVDTFTLTEPLGL